MGRTFRDVLRRLLRTRSSGRHRGAVSIGPGVAAGVERQRHGGGPARVINIGSIDGLSAGPFENYGYGAAKAALGHLTELLARELGSRHVTVNCLALGPILTKMTSALFDKEAERLTRNNPLGRLGRPWDVMAPLLMLAGPGGAYITGVTLPVDGGFAINRWCDG